MQLIDIAETPDMPPLERIRCSADLTYRQLAKEWATSAETARNACLSRRLPRRPLLLRIMAWCQAKGAAIHLTDFYQPNDLEEALK